MTDTIESMRKMVAGIETRKVRIAAERDGLRNALDEFEQLLEDLDSGVEDIETGVRSIESGLDAISQTV